MKTQGWKACTKQGDKYYAELDALRKEEQKLNRHTGSAFNGSYELSLGDIEGAILAQNEYELGHFD